MRYRILAMKSPEGDGRIRQLAREVGGMALIATTVPAVLIFSAYMADKLPKGPKGESDREKAQRFQKLNEGQGKGKPHGSGKAEGETRGAKGGKTRRDTNRKRR